MTRLRKTIALRLKESQNTAAQLTTFNEVDMTAVMGLRATYKDVFEKRHGVKLGFMGFFTKAVVAALKDLPNVNAEIEAITSSTRTTMTSASRFRPSAAWWYRWCATPIICRWPALKRRSAISACAPATTS
jgi:pyruvate/2-oxoglutarate dehydrogenase complex dihydrolipoamide acyltransferase (E2) component